VSDVGVAEGAGAVMFLDRASESMQ